MRLILVSSTALCAALLLTGCDIEDFGPSDRYRTDFHYTLKPADRLSVENFNGEIEIAGWDEPSIEVTGVKYSSSEDALREMNVEVHESAGLAELRTTRSNVFHGNQGARYLIRAPRKTLLDRIVSSNGSVRIHDMTASAKIHTSNGPVRVENVSGGLDAQTSNGTIELDSVTGHIDLRTSNGRIRASELTGQCTAETSNGSVTLRFKDAPDGPTRIHTSNGSVDVTMSRSPKDSVRAETSNGSISLDLPANLAAKLDARTSQSSISSDFEVMSSYSDKEKHHLEGNIGAGGPMIELTTHNGGIHIRKSSSIN